MDYRGKRSNKLLGSRNNKIYMDLKDILREHALPFLPAKSLFRFRKVCRDWKLQISSPFFAHNQSFSFRKISGLFVQNLNEPPSFVSLDPEACGLPDPSLKFLPGPVDVKSSSNGLLCCQGKTGNMPYYICNPVTKEWKEIPKSDVNHGDNPALVLVFQPSLLNFVAEYKIVCAFRSQDFEDAIEFDIYSSKEGTWKPSAEINFAFKKFMPKTGVYGNGIIYWPSPNDGYLLAFDLDNERSHTVVGYINNVALGMVDGKLCRAHVSGQEIYVVELNNDNFSNTMPMGSSSSKFLLNSSSSSKAKAAANHPVVLDKAVVGDSITERASVPFLWGSMVVVQLGMNLYSSNLNTGETKRLPFFALREGKCIPYVNSLVSLI